VESIALIISVSLNTLLVVALIRKQERLKARASLPDTRIIMTPSGPIRVEKPDRGAGVVYNSDEYLWAKERDDGLGPKPGGTNW
jgi:hypothetical protein